QAGVSLVYRGRRLEDAARHLGETVRLKPKNPEYRLALGCALVRRAVVLHDASRSAASYEKQKAKYPVRYAAWERAQSDSESLLYGAKPPLLPVPSTTRDDNKAFTLTPAQAKERAGDLCRRALAEWEAAVAAARTDSERANAHFVRGWGMILIRRIGSEFVQNLPGSSTFGQYEPWLEEKLIPTTPHIVEAFEAALALAPGNARYWQSLGDAYVADFSRKGWNPGKAIAAYEKALKLDRRSPTLWYQLYYLQESSDPIAAAASIAKAAEKDPANAFYWYLLANLLLERYGGKGAEIGSKKDAGKAASRSPDSPYLTAGLAALEKGNGGTFRPASYLYAVPKILAPLNPVDIGVSDALYGLYILHVPENVAVAVKAHLATGDSASGVSAARTAVGFSDKMMALALADTETNPYNEFLDWMFTSSAISISYSSLADALERAGNVEEAFQTRAKRTELDTLARKRALRGLEVFKTFQQ
ncbi:MAG: hypothetical protein H7Z41_02960, partial [Cytophagales bacterium]|nr:hypothetical protein [Armatimonadota bacterium]